jgi:isopenicillin-N epimerase
VVEFETRHQKPDMLTADSRSLFLFASNLTYLNHGGFGATPRSVLDEKKRILDEIEKNPMDFLAHKIRLKWHQVAEKIASRFSCQPNSVAIVDNATDGVEAVLHSLPLKAADEILITSMTYGAVAMAARHIAAKQGAKITVAELLFPDPEPEQCIAAIAQTIRPRTKIAIFDHIASATALVMPLREMIDACQARGVPVLVDGAHAPGQVALDIPALKADWYVGNLHKWYFVPRGCGFLWAAPGRASGLMPNVLSWEMHQPFPSNFAWTGTRDPSNWLAIPAAFDFMDRMGESAVRQHNHQLMHNAVALLADLWKFRVSTPDTMTAAMTLVPTPDGLPYPATDEGRRRLEADLKDKFDIVLNPAFAHAGRIWLRITAQIYNDLGDYEKLGKNVLALPSNFG